MQVVVSVAVLSTMALPAVILFQLQSRRKVISVSNPDRSDNSDHTDHNAEHSPHITEKETFARLSRNHGRSNTSIPKIRSRHPDDPYQVDEHEPLPFEQLDTAACTPQGQQSLRERLMVEEQLLHAQLEQVSF